MVYIPSSQWKNPGMIHQWISEGFLFSDPAVSADMILWMVVNSQLVDDKHPHYPIAYHVSWFPIEYKLVQDFATIHCMTVFVRSFLKFHIDESSHVKQETSKTCSIILNHKHISLSHIYIYILLHIYILYMDFILWSLINSHHNNSQYTSNVSLFHWWCLLLAGWLLSAISALSEFEGAIATLFRKTRYVKDLDNMEVSWVMGVALNFDDGIFHCETPSTELGVPWLWNPPVNLQKQFQ